MYIIHIRISIVIIKYSRYYYMHGVEPSATVQPRSNQTFPCQCQVMQIRVIMTTGKQVCNGLYSPGPCLWILKTLHDHPEPKFYIFWPCGWWNHGKRSMIWDVFGRYLKAPQMFPMHCCNKERRWQQIQGNSTRLTIVISFAVVLFIQHGNGKSTISYIFS